MTKGNREAAPTITDPPIARAGWIRHDINWRPSLLGTAAGAGILFLPINAGIGGV